MVLILFALGEYFMIRVWEYLELEIYGQIQPRIVDDVMFLLWSAFVIIAYLIGRADEQNKHTEDNNEIRRTESEANQRR